MIVSNALVTDVIPSLFGRALQYPSQTLTMKTVAFVLASLSSALAFAPSATPLVHSSALNMVDLANGAMSFDHVCREWRCKYTGDKATSESLESISKALDEVLPDIKKVSKDIKVNRLVCGSCL